MLHATVTEALLEIHAQRFEACARRLYIRHRNTDMTEATRIGIAIVVSKIGVVFSAVVMGQLQDARDRLHPLAARSVILRDLCWINQRQEVQAELGFRVIMFLN